MSNEMVKLSEAHQALAVARTLEEVKYIRDVAIAARKYAEARKLGEESVRYAQEVVNRATRRMGEMLIAEEGFGRGKKSSTIDDFDITHHQAKVSQDMARIPEEVFEGAANRAANRLFLIAREANAAERRAQRIAATSVVGETEIRHGDFREVLSDLEGTVDAIITDPPYKHEYWPLYTGLGEVARKILKPTGILAVMIGPGYPMNDAVGPMIAQNMVKRWRGIYLVPGQKWRAHQEHVATGYKPILIYAHPDGDQKKWRWINDDVFLSRAREQDTRFHQWGQTETGFADIVHGLTEQGDLVVDPFLGGGTTAVVCRDLGRRFIGCDSDAAAVSISRERIEG